MIKVKINQQQQILMVNPFVKQQTDRQYTHTNNERNEIQPTYPSVDQGVVCEENAMADVCETIVDRISFF